MVRDGEKINILFDVANNYRGPNRGFWNISTIVGEYLI
jgi:hypothetical protein